jgi:ribosomal protein L37AE/L43A
MPILWGMPAPEAMPAVERGSLAVGGCLAWGDERDKQWACRACGAEFHGDQEAVRQALERAVAEALARRRPAEE